MPSHAFVKTQSLANDWNKKLEKKHDQIIRKINEHSDYTDDGLVRLLRMDEQRATLVEQMVANNIKARKILDDSDKFHGY